MLSGLRSGAGAAAAGAGCLGRVVDAGAILLLLLPLAPNRRPLRQLRRRLPRTWRRRQGARRSRRCARRLLRVRSSWALRPQRRWDNSANSVEVDQI